jgi:hypothetical protein
MMFVGIQPNEGHAIDDEIIVSFFKNRGYEADDEFISKGENRFSYFNVEFLMERFLFVKMMTMRNFCLWEALNNF